MINQTKVEYMQDEYIQRLRDQFIRTCKNINRDGIMDLLRYVEEKTDFFVAPASTKYHGNYKGGLLEHSLNVYHAVFKLNSMIFPDIVIPPDSLAITALFHDLCKANYYELSSRNVKDEATGRWSKVPCYITNDQFPVGHGEKSVILLMKYISLTDDEILAIRWHMSAFDSAAKGGDYGLSKAYEQSPLAVMLHLADMMASYLMESRSTHEEE